jgi:hypothetical protein
MIRYYLGEEPSLAQVDTYVCAREADYKYVLEHLDQLVVKAVDEAGGYGMLMGPQSTAAQREEFKRRIQAEPRKYIAQHRSRRAPRGCPPRSASHRGAWTCGPSSSRVPTGRGFCREASRASRWWRAPT